jgi:hypothetical protein
MVSAEKRWRFVIHTAKSRGVLVQARSDAVSDRPRKRGISEYKLGFRCFQAYQNPNRPPPNTRMQSDRFAREIVAFLMLPDAAHLRRLMRRPLGGKRQLVREDSFQRVPVSQ